jgi:hypothetical protein
MERRKDMTAEAFTGATGTLPLASSAVGGVFQVAITPPAPQKVESEAGDEERNRKVNQNDVLCVLRRNRILQVKRVQCRLRLTGR